MLLARAVAPVLVGRWLLGAVLSTPAVAQVLYEAAPQLQPRIRHQMVGDAQRVLLTGGVQGASSSSNPFPDVWEFANGSWNRRGTIAYPTLLSDSAYDRVRQRFVGLVQPGSFGCSLVEWNGTQTSTQTNVPNSLYFCERFGITFDASRGACVVHGFDLQTGNNELWTYDGSNWQQLSVATGPGWGAFRLLTAGGDLLLVGQSFGSGVLEAWLWQGGAWTAQPVPAFDVYRYDATNDPVNGAALLAGYPSGATAISVQVWNGAGWSLLGTGGPDLGSEFRVAHDGTQLVLFGGIHYGTPNVYHGETWSFAAGVFTVLGGQQPQPLGDVLACFDAARQRTVVQGSNGLQTETWEWDGSQFALRHSVTGLVGEAAMAFDRSRGVVVQYRGDGTTMEWNGSTWTTVVPAGAGPSRYGAGLAFDGQRVVLFGGGVLGQSGYVNETWGYDGVAWTWLAPAAAPPTGLFQPRLVEDPRRGVVVLIASQHNTVYEWNGSTWSAVGSVPWTGVRQEQFVGYHPARGRVVVGAGQFVSYSPYYNLTATRQVWEWNGAAFQALANTPGDHVRSAAAAGPDGDLVLVGGWDASYHLRGDVVAMRSVYPATVRTFGSGCAGSASVAAVGGEPWQWPWLGDTVVLRCGPLPPTASAVAWVLGLSRSQDAFGMLPRDLTTIGAPGCMQRVAVDAWWVEPAAGSTSSTAVWVPPDQALLGLSTHLQVLIPDGANPFGFVLSDAVSATIGSR